MKAIRYLGAHKISVDDVEVPQVPQGWVLIEVAYAGICGSDLTIYAGKHPRAKPPLIMGHEFSGYIRSKSKFPKGTLVTVYPYLACGSCEICKRGDFHICENLRLIGIDLNGGMAEYAAVPENNIYPVRTGISPQLAAFIEPVGIAVHAVRKGGYSGDGRVVIFGAGAMGLLCGLVLRNFGATDILITDPNQSRNHLAAQMGFQTIAPEENSTDAILRWTHGKGADFVFDCAGNQSVVDVLPDVVRINGRIIIVAGYKDPPSMDFQKGMFRELTIQFVRNCSRSDFETACQIIHDDYSRILNCTLPIADAQNAFNGPASAYKVMFQIGK